MTPDNKDLLRAESQERIDAPDFQHLSRQVLSWHESIASLLSSSSLIRGFELSVVDPTTLRVTPDTGADKGVIIVPEFGAANNQAPHGAVTSYSVVVDLNPTAKDRGLATYAVGQFLHVYASAVWNATKLDQRVFWIPPSGPESTSPINTRFVLEWQLSVVEHHQPAPTRSVRVGTIWWSGALTAPDLYQSAQMLFEGVAVDGGSAVAVPAGGVPAFSGYWTLADEGTIPDFSRSDDRWTNGAKTFAEFSQMVLREIQELKSQSRVTTPKHWEKPPSGLSVRAAQPCTFTLGTGHKLSEGNQNGPDDALNPGYTSIAPGLTLLIADAVAEGLEEVCILLKPGKFSITTQVVIPGDFRLEIRGSGPLTTELKITDNGQIVIETNAATEVSAGFTLGDMFLWGTTADNLIEVQSSHIGTETTYRLENLKVQHTAGASWFRQTQEGRGARLQIHGVRTDDESSIRFLNLSEIIVADSHVAHIYAEKVIGTVEEQISVEGSHFVSLRVDEGIENVLISGSTFHHLNLTDCDLITIAGVETVCCGVLEDALGAVTTAVTISNTARVLATGSIFQTHDNAASCIFHVDGCGRVEIDGSGFIIGVGATTVPAYGLRATNMTPGPLEGPKAILQGCWLETPGEIWVDGFVIDECRFLGESATLGQDTLIANASSIVESDILITQGTPTKLLDTVGPIRSCSISANAIGPGQGEIIPDGDLTILDSEIHLDSGGMIVTVAGDIRLRDVIVTGSPPNTMIFTPDLTNTRVVLESVKSSMEVRVTGDATHKVSLTMTDCDAKRLNATAALVHASLIDSVFDEGALLYLRGTGWKSSVIAKGCAFYPKRAWSSGEAGDLSNALTSLNGFGLQITDDEVNGTGIERVVVEDCEFWQELDTSSIYSAIWVRATDGHEIVVRNNHFHLLWPSANWASVLGSVSLSFAERVVVEGNQFWCQGTGTSRVGPLVDVNDSTATSVTRSQISFDDNGVSFVAGVQFDTTFEGVLTVSDVGTMVDSMISFCRNKINAKWGVPNPRVTWTDNLGQITAANAIGVAYENLIIDAGGVVVAFNPTSPNGNMIDIFAGAHDHNFFA